MAELQVAPQLADMWLAINESFKDRLVNQPEEKRFKTDTVLDFPNPAS